MVHSDFDNAPARLFGRRVVMYISRWSLGLLWQHFVLNKWLRESQCPTISDSRLSLPHVKPTTLQGDMGAIVHAVGDGDEHIDKRMFSVRTKESTVVPSAEC